MAAFILIFLSTVIVLIFCKKDYILGLCVALGILVVFPQDVGIKTSEMMPAITLHRVMLIALLVVWLSKGYFRLDLPLLKLFIIYIIFSTVSLVLSPFFAASFKTYLGFVIESGLFYLIYVSSIRTADDVHRISKALVISILVVAVLGIIERYSPIHPLLVFPLYHQEYAKLGEGYRQGIVFSTFVHPILLGVTLAVGLLMNVFYVEKKKLGFIVMLMLGICLFFTFSRGPWLAAILGFIIIFLFYKKARSVIIMLSIAAVLALLIRPGAFKSIDALFSATFNPDAVEGHSFYYRLELWRIAYDHISVSLERFLFGFGMEYHRVADLSGDFVLTGGVNTFRSWDSEFACIFLEGGFFGIISFLALLISIGIITIKNFKRLTGENRNLMICIGSGIIAVMFMMTNVKMFSQQLLIVFWALVAMGVRFKQEEEIIVEDEADREISYALPMGQIAGNMVKDYWHSDRPEG